MDSENEHWVVSQQSWVPLLVWQLIICVRLDKLSPLSEPQEPTFKVGVLAQMFFMVLSVTPFCESKYVFGEASIAQVLLG